ncbi:hypothetical protein ACFVH6_06795 [Spirillospora sp. NPDC127200]
MTATMRRCSGPADRRPMQELTQRVRSPAGPQQQLGELPQRGAEDGMAGRPQRFGVVAALRGHDLDELPLAVEFGERVAGEDGRLGPDADLLADVGQIVPLAVIAELLDTGTDGAELFRRCTPDLTRFRDLRLAGPVSRHDSSTFHRLRSLPVSLR